MFGEKITNQERVMNRSVVMMRHPIFPTRDQAILSLFITLREYSLFTAWPLSIKKFTMTYALALKKFTLDRTCCVLLGVGDVFEAH
jgi:hypothetical protein